MLISKTMAAVSKGPVHQWKRKLRSSYSKTIAAIRYWVDIATIESSGPPLAYTGTPLTVSTTSLVA